MVYYAIALALYTGSGTREVRRCLFARGTHGPAQQDTRAGPAGVLGPAAGALRRARADARGGAAGRQGPGPAPVPARGAGGPAQAAAVRGPSPLGTGVPCTRRCWTRSWRSVSQAAEAGKCRAGSNAR